MRTFRSIALALIATVALALPASAITHGFPDDGEHPYVGQLFFFVPDVEDPRFDDPGTWFNCTGTLMDATIVVTAGHCTFGVGLGGESTTNGGEATDAASGGVGGNDIWISFAPAPDYSILNPSTSFNRDQAARYAQWTAALDASSEWHRGTATPHPEYDDIAFFLHDAGVVELDASVTMPKYGALPPAGYLDQYTGKAKKHVFEAVGYGLQKSTGSKAIGGDVREKSDPRLDTLKSTPPDTYAILSNNASTGGTCFGDSGGPTFDNTTSNLVVAVTSFGNNNCTGHGGVYRLDQPDDQEFLEGFGIEP